MDFPRVLDLVAQQLASRGQRWAVAGGVAMQTYGLARTTQDLDFVAESAGASELVPWLESVGYETLYRSAAFSNHLHADAALGRIDFIYVDPTTASALFPATRLVEWNQRSLRVPSPIHMVAMKVHAMKNDPSRTLREMADIQYLLQLPDADRPAARRYFERAGLLERFNEIAGFL
jgi:hypothetical protein